MSSCGGLTGRSQLDVIECCRVSTAGSAFDAQGVAAFELNAARGEASGVVAVWPPRGQLGVGVPGCNGMFVDAEGEMRSAALEIEVLYGDVEAAACTGVGPLGGAAGRAIA